ncbi:hypothetical protein DPEC_G00106570 [Dallia pectoralis]|uniref:Uncharacterized protein n=1 Tax=Dallia pectoralis TaxID=75939 RepID=A0ACC2GYQ3_DALPE|nr:hypothetical protein DPEC_G00106570 [Dallia pectoralis]
MEGRRAVHLLGLRVLMSWVYLWSATAANPLVDVNAPEPTEPLVMSPGDPQSQLQPFYPVYPVTQLLPSLNTFTPEQQAQVIYTMMMLPGVGPVLQSQGLSVDPNPDPFPITTDPSPVTSEPSNAHLQNPPTEAVTEGHMTPKPETGRPVVEQIKTGLEPVTEGGWLLGTDSTMEAILRQNPTNCSG